MLKGRGLLVEGNSEVTLFALPGYKLGLSRSEGSIGERKVLISQLVRSDQVALLPKHVLRTGLYLEVSVKQALMVFPKAGQLLGMASAEGGELVL
jgi:hypothetical protein